MNKLKELRTENGKLQREIAEYLGIDRTTYGKYETGASEPDFETLSRIADLYKVSVDYLLGRTEEKNPTTNEDRGIEDIKAALFGGDTEVTDEMWEELQEFIKFIKHKNQN